MLLWIVIIFLGCLALGNYLVERSVLYPPFIFSVIWLIVLSVYSMDLIEVDELHTKVLLVLAGGALLFSLGGAMGRLVPGTLIRTKLKILPTNSRNVYPWFQYLMFALGIVGMLIVLKATLAAGAGGTGATFLARARSGTGEGSDPTILGTYAPELVIFSAVLISMERRDWLFWVMTGVAFATGVFTTSRGPVLQLMCGIVTVTMIRRNRTSFLAAMRFVRVPAVFFLVVFFTLVFTTKDLSGLEGGVSGIIIYSLVTYLVGPTAALDNVLENPSLYADRANHTLKLPLQFLAKAHLIAYTPPPLLDEFVAVPFPANVYTGYKFFYTDYGLIGVIVIIFLIGMTHTLLYRKAVSGSQLALFWFSMSTLQLVMFFFDDGYFALGVQLTILTFGSLYLTMRSVSLMGPATYSERALAS